MKYRFGFVQEYEGKTALVSDVIEKEIMEGAVFVQAQMRLSSISEALGMNIYEFCRLFSEARKSQAREAAAIRKQEKNGRRNL